MSIFKKNSETTRSGKSRHLLTKKFFNMRKNNKVKPVLQRNGIKNSHLVLNINKLQILA